VNLKNLKTKKQKQISDTCTIHEKNGIEVDLLLSMFVTFPMSQLEILVFPSYAAALSNTKQGVNYMCRKKNKKQISTTTS